MKQINKNKPLEKESDFQSCHIMFSFQQQKNETNKETGQKAINVLSLRKSSH